MCLGLCVGGLTPGFVMAEPSVIDLADVAIMQQGEAATCDQDASFTGFVDNEFLVPATGSESYTVVDSFSTPGSTIAEAVVQLNLGNYTTNGEYPDQVLCEENALITISDELGILATVNPFDAGLCNAPDKANAGVEAVSVPVPTLEGYELSGDDEFTLTFSVDNDQSDYIHKFSKLEYKTNLVCNVSLDVTPITDSVGATCDLDGSFSAYTDGDVIIPATGGNYTVSDVHAVAGTTIENAMIDFYLANWDGTDQDICESDVEVTITNTTTGATTTVNPFTTCDAPNTDNAGVNSLQLALPGLNGEALAGNDTWEIAFSVNGQASGFKHKFFAFDYKTVEECVIETTPVSFTNLYPEDGNIMPTCDVNDGMGSFSVVTDEDYLIPSNGANFIITDTTSPAGSTITNAKLDLYVANYADQDICEEDIEVVVTAADGTSVSVSPFNTACTIQDVASAGVAQNPGISVTDVPVDLDGFELTGDDAFTVEFLVNGQSSDFTHKFFSLNYDVDNTDVCVFEEESNLVITGSPATCDLDGSFSGKMDGEFTVSVDGGEGYLIVDDLSKVGTKVKNPTFDLYISNNDATQNVCESDVMVRIEGPNGDVMTLKPFDVIACEAVATAPNAIRIPVTVPLIAFEGIEINGDDTWNISFMTDGQTSPFYHKFSEISYSTVETCVDGGDDNGNKEEEEGTRRPTVRNGGGSNAGTVLGVSDSNDRSTGAVLGAEDTNVLAQAVNNVNDTPTPAPAALAQTGHGVPFMVILMSLVAMSGAVVRFRTFRA